MKGNVLSGTVTRRSPACRRAGRLYNATPVRLPVSRAKHPCPPGPYGALTRSYAGVPTLWAPIPTTEGAV